MKINKEIRAQIDQSKLVQQANQRQGIDFQKMVQTQAQKMQGYELEKLMESIQKQGDKVIRYRTIRELAKYKRLVKDFVKEAVDFGLGVSHSHSFNTTGSNRKLTLVKTIDDKLVDLTEAILADEERSIDLLGLIGEIKGLLINLYS